MHAWLPDAHSEGPSPISAMLSGALLAAALYAVLRIGAIAQGAAGTTYVAPLLLVFGVLSLLLAALFALRQVNYKRLLAYSSIEHMGIVSLGIGIGGPIAAYGAFLHVLAHAAGKSLAFFGAGELLSRYETRAVGRGSRRDVGWHRLTGFMVLCAAIAICGYAAVRPLPQRGPDRPRRLRQVLLLPRRPADRDGQRRLRRALPDLPPHGALERPRSRRREQPRARSSR